MTALDDLEKICNMHYKYVKSYALSLCLNEAIAEDITQDTFLVFQLKVEQLEDEHIIAWLINTASNLIKHYLIQLQMFIH